MVSTETHTDLLWHKKEDSRYRCEKIRDKYARTIFGGDVDFIVKEAGEHYPPAWYEPLANIITINMSRISLHDVDDDVFEGVVYHELGHKTWTKWSLKEASKFDSRVRQIIIWFEEIRVEKNVVDFTYKVDKLRASFRWVLSQLTEIPPRSNLDLCGLWILSVGRLMAGVCAPEEVQAIDDFVRNELGDSAVTFMGDILDEAINVPNLPSGLGTLKALAEELVELTSSDDDEVGSKMIEALGGCHHDEDAEENQSNDDDDDGTCDPLDPAKGQGVRDSVHIPDNPDAPAPGPLSPDYPDIDTSVYESAIEDVSKALKKEYSEPVKIHDPKVEVKELHRRSSRKGSDYTDVMPSPESRIRADDLAKILLNMQLPAVTKSLHNSELPPGRLNGRELVRVGADRAAGRMSSARPWKTTKRKHVQSKPVRIACLTDVSGSMWWAQDLIAEFSWIVATAGARIKAETAAIAYGNSAYPVSFPHEYPKVIRKYECTSSTEMFSKAAAAADGMLRLSVKDGASKILFNVSDGMYVEYREMERTHMWLKKWHEAGVQVVWIVQNIYECKSLTSEIPSYAEIIVGPTVDELVAKLRGVLLSP